MTEPASPVYYAAAETGAYLGCVPHDLAAPPDGALVVPAPPRADATWTGEAWEAPADLATRFYVDGEGRCLGAWTDPTQAPEGALAVDSPPGDGTDIWNGTDWVADVGLLIARRCRDVDALRETKFANGMAYQGKVLQLGEVDQQRIIAAGATAKFALLQGGNLPEGFGWIMADNTVLPLDAAGMSAMADTAAAQVQAWIFKGHTHKQALRALTDLAAIEAYDIETGW